MVNLGKIWLSRNVAFYLFIYLVLSFGAPVKLPEHIVNVPFSVTRFLAKSKLSTLLNATLTNAWPELFKTLPRFLFAIFTVPRKIGPGSYLGFYIKMATITNYWPTVAHFQITLHKTRLGSFFIFDMQRSRVFHRANLPSM